MRVGETELKTAMASLAAAGLIAFRAGAAAEGDATAKPGAPATNETVVLRMREGADLSAATIWRCYEVWRNDVVRKDSGELVTVDLLTPRLAREGDGPLVPWWMHQAGGEDLVPARTVAGAPWPPERWQDPEFDDSGWPRIRDIQRAAYRSIALTCIRGKFDVSDPGRAPDLSLHLGFRGGAVVYLNGKEIGRSHLPEGPIGPETLAREYPAEAYASVDGALIPQTIFYNKVLTYMSRSEADAVFAKPVFNDRHFTNAADVARYKARFRALDAGIPKTLLKKGTNVLAVEIHRAPAHPAMFLAP